MKVHHKTLAQFVYGGTTYRADIHGGFDVPAHVTQWAVTMMGCKHGEPEIVELPVAVSFPAPQETPPAAVEPVTMADDSTPEPVKGKRGRPRGR